MAVVASLVAVSCGDGSRSGSGATPGADSYHVVYRIVEPDGADRTEELLVRRPYEARILTRGDDEVRSGRLTNREVVWLPGKPPDGGWTLLQPGPQRASPDPLPFAALPYALEHALARDTGRAEVLGRGCRLVRTGATPSESLPPPGESDYVQLCIDETGVILSEVEIRAGRAAAADGGRRVE